MGLFTRTRSVEVDKTDYSTEQRVRLAGEGKAIPVKRDGKIVDGRYPIDNRADLENAIQAFGRADDKATVKAHIVSQARRLGAADTLPDGWTSKAEWTVPLIKDEARRLVTGVVMQPDVPDSEGDTTSAEEIEQAAHRYLAESRLQDIQHNEQQADVVPVESYITPQDMDIAGRGVLKGSWVMTSYVADDGVWEAITKGELTGYSIGGTAVRQD